jgi:hypothetical protein
MFRLLNGFTLACISVNHDLESLENQQQEGEYLETIAKPVQRHMDSLKRQHDIPLKASKIEMEEEIVELPPLPASPMPIV